MKRVPEFPLSPIAKLLQLEEIILASELLAGYGIITAPVVKDKHNLSDGHIGFINLLAFDPYYAEFSQAFSHSPLDQAVASGLVSQQQRGSWEEAIRINYRDAITELINKIKERVFEKEQPPLSLIYLLNDDKDKFQQWLHESSVDSVDIRTLALLQSYTLKEVLGGIQKENWFRSIPSEHNTPIKLPSENDLQSPQVRLQVVLDALVYGPWVGLDSDILDGLIRNKIASASGFHKIMETYVGQCKSVKLQKFTIPIFQPHTPLGVLVYGFRKLQSATKTEAVHNLMRHQASKISGVFQLFRTKVAARCLKSSSPSPPPSRQSLQQALISLIGAAPEISQQNGCNVVQEVISLRGQEVNYASFGKADLEHIERYKRQVEWQLEVATEEHIRITSNSGGTQYDRLRDELEKLFNETGQLTHGEIVFLLLMLPTYQWLVMQKKNEVDKKLKIGIGTRSGSLPNYLNHVKAIDNDACRLSLPSPFRSETKNFLSKAKLTRLHKTENNNATQFFVSFIELKKITTEKKFYDEKLKKIGLKVDLLGGSKVSDVIIVPDDDRKEEMGVEELDIKSLFENVSSA